jgi:hypothetical protein
MDANECSTLIAAARGAAGSSAEALLEALDAAEAKFGKAAKRLGK